MCASPTKEAIDRMPGNLGLAVEESQTSYPSLSELPSNLTQLTIQVICYEGSTNGLLAFAPSPVEGFRMVGRTILQAGET